MFNVSDTYEIFNNFECILHLSTLKGDYFSMVVCLVGPETRWPVKSEDHASIAVVDMVYAPAALWPLY